MSPKADYDWEQFEAAETKPSYDWDQFEAAPPKSSFERSRVPKGASTFERIVEAGKKKPGSLMQQLPAAMAEAGGRYLDVPQQIASLMDRSIFEKMGLKPSAQAPKFGDVRDQLPIDRTKGPFDQFGEWTRSNLPPEEREMAKRTAEAEADLLQFLPWGLLSKKVPPSSGTVPRSPMGQSPIISPPSRQISGPSLTDIIGPERISPFEVLESHLQKTQPARVDIPRNRLPAPMKGMVEERRSPGSVLSPFEFESETAGGKTLNTIIPQEAANARKPVTEAYDRARENYRNIHGISPKLSSELETMLTDLEGSWKPNTPEAELIRTLKTIRDELGDSTSGYKQIPVSRLIKQSDSISSTLNYDLQFAGQKGTLRKIVKMLDDAAMEMIKEKGGNPSLLKDANKMFGKWSDLFSNDAILPYMKRDSINPEGLFKSATETPSALRAVTDALPSTAEGKAVRNALERKYAESRTQKYRGKKELDREYRQEIRNLGGVIGGGKASTFERRFRQEETRAKHAVKKPEDYIKKMDTRSGIKEIRDELPSDVFDTLAQSKVQSILKEGLVEKKPKGKDLADVLNKEHPTEILTELLGKEAVEGLREYFKSVAKKELTREVTINLLKVLAKGGINMIILGKINSYLIKPLLRVL